MNKNILIVGSKGFLGSHIQKYFSELGSQIFVWQREGENYNKNQIRDGSIAEIINQLLDSEITVIVHCATRYVRDDNYTHAMELLESNVSLGYKLLMAAMQANIESFIYFKSHWERDENSLIYSPQNLYSATKGAFSIIIDYYSRKESTCRIISLEVPETYGSDDRRNKLIPNLIQSIKDNSKIALISPDICLSYVHVRDLLQAIRLSINNVSITSGTYSIFEKSPVRLGDLVDWIKMEIKSEMNFEWTDDGRTRRRSYIPRYPLLPNYKQKEEFFTAFKSLISET